VVEFIETLAGNFHSKKPQKSPEASDEESEPQVDRHGIARYSMG
jgi:hypothetical protein